MQFPLPEAEMLRALGQRDAYAAYLALTGSGVRMPPLYTVAENTWKMLVEWVQNLTPAHREHYVRGFRLAWESASKETNANRYGASLVVLATVAAQRDGTMAALVGIPETEPDIAMSAWRAFEAHVIVPAEERDPLSCTFVAAFMSAWRHASNLGDNRAKN